MPPSLTQKTYTKPKTTLLINFPQLSTPTMYYKTLSQNNLLFKWFFYRPNNQTIEAVNSQKLHISIGDIVSFAMITNNKIQHNHVHKILRVRRDLTWEDVVKNSSKFAPPWKVKTNYTNHIKIVIIKLNFHRNFPSWLVIKLSAWFSECSLFQFLLAKPGNVRIVSFFGIMYVKWR